MVRKGQIVEGMPDGAEQDALIKRLTIGCIPCVNSVTVEFAGFKDSAYQQAKSVVEDTGLPYSASTFRGREMAGGTDCRDGCPNDVSIPTAVEMLQEAGFVE